MIIRPLIQSAAMVVAMTFIFGCSTVQGRHQRVRVATDVDEAELLQDGQRVGSAPGFIKLKRQYDSELTYRFREQEIKHKLQTKFRWSTTLFGNALLALVTGPGGLVGLAIDFFTGAAWTLVDPSEAKFFPQIKVPPLKPRSIAIILPQSESQSLSREMSRQLVGKLNERYPGATVIPFERNESLFASYGVTDSAWVKSQGKEHYNNFVHHLGATHLCLSTVKVKGGKIIVQAALLDAVRKQQVDQFVAETDRRETSIGTNGNGRFFKDLLLELMPNSIGVNRSQEYFDIYEAKNFELQKTSSDGFLGSGYSIVAGNLRHRNLRQEFGYSLRWVSAVTLTRTDIDLEIFFTGEELQYHWYRLGLGLGLELGLEVSPTVFYFSISGIPTYNIVRGNRSDTAEISDWSTPVALEFGMSTFLGERWAGKIFGRYTTNPIWEKVLELEDLAPNSIESAFGMSEGGIQLVYYFPELNSHVYKLVNQTGDK